MANIPNAAPHLLRPDPLPGQDSEALPEDIPELDTSGLEVTADRPSDQVMDNVAEANSHAETGKSSSGLILTPQSRKT